MVQVLAGSIHLSELRRQAVHGIWWNLFNTTSQTVLQMAQLLILARLLEPRDYGLAGMAYVMSGFLQVFQDMGFSAVVVQRKDLRQNQLSSLYWLNILSGIGLFVAMGLLGMPTAAFYSMPPLWGMMAVLGLNFLLLSAGLQYAWLAERELRFSWLSRLDIASGMIGSIASIILAFWGFGAWSIVLGQTIAGAVRTAALVHGGRRTWKPSRHFAWSDLQGLRRFGIYQMAERTLNYFNSRVDQLVLGRMLGAYELGLYSFGFNLSSRLSDKTNPVVTRVAFPVLSKVQDDRERQKSIYLFILHALTLVNAPLHLGFAVLAPDIVPLFFHEKWMPAVPILQIIAVVYLMRSTGNPVGSLALSAGRADLTFWWNVIAFTVTPAAVVAGGILGGLQGIAWALLATQLLYFWPAYRMMVRPVLGGCFGTYLAAVLRPMSLAALATGAMWLLGQKMAAGPVRLAVLAAMGVVVYAILVVLFDRAAISRTWSLIRRRKLEGDA